MCSALQQLKRGYTCSECSAAVEVGLHLPLAAQDVVSNVGDFSHVEFSVWLSEITAVV